MAATGKIFSSLSIDLAGILTNCLVQCRVTNVVHFS